MSEIPKLKFSDESKNIVFEDLNPKLVFADEFKKLVFDVAVVDYLLIGSNSFLLIGTGNSKLRI
ncbi:unnamed protein product [marine sediment metagenome]|uniref:Uncharacterized protein n=1 Tax=marine sediment metagenome TaxID=412755 RepID=X1AH04_9ZZZZ